MCLTLFYLLLQSMTKVTKISTSSIIVLLLTTFWMVAGPVVQHVVSHPNVEQSVSHNAKSQHDKHRDSSPEKTDFVLKPYQAVSSFSLHFLSLEGIIEPFWSSLMGTSDVVQGVKVYSTSILLRLLDCQLSPNAP